MVITEVGRRRKGGRGKRREEKRGSKRERRKRVFKKNGVRKEVDGKKRKKGEM